MPLLIFQEGYFYPIFDKTNTYQKMEKEKHALICSVTGLAAMTAVSMLYGEIKMVDLITYCECSVAIALLGFSFLFPPMLTVCCVVVVLLMPGRRVEILPVAVAFVMTVDAIVRMRRRYSSVRPLFRNDAVWKSLEEASGIVASLLLADNMILLLVATSLSCVEAEIMAGGIAVLLYVFVILKYLRGRTVLLKLSAQEEILTLARGCLRPHEFDPDTDDKRMTALYRRVLDFMDEEKPFLDEEISLEQFSRHVYSNKTYLSKTINVMSGHNFRQFINYYRVEYSITLLKENPSRRVEDVALMSGFHNVVSFNMAFRLFMSETPTEWMRENHVKD